MRTSEALPEIYRQKTHFLQIAVQATPDIFDE
jgi:hypothetical protein